MRLELWAEIIIGTAIGNDDTKDKRSCQRTVTWAARAPSGMDLSMYYHILTTRRICPLHHTSPIIVPKRPTCVIYHVISSLVLFREHP